MAEHDKRGRSESTQTRTSLDELIAKLEAASKGSQRLDGSIWCNAEPEEYQRRLWDAKSSMPRGAPMQDAHERICERSAPHYTTSIDAALTLVPKYCQWTLEPDAAWVRWCDGEDVHERQGHFFRRDGEQTALALCIAALKARRDTNPTT